MNYVLIAAFLFCIGSMVGWGIEVIFRRFFSANNPQRRWINPGFLIGPCLPLYGFSLCILFTLAMLGEHIGGSTTAIHDILLFCVMAVCVTGAEFLAGLGCVKIAKVRLWDYSDEKGNIMGLICPKFSVFWWILSAIYYFLIHPHILDALAWLAENLAFSFCIGFFFGVFAIDLAYSIQLVARIRSFADEHEIVVRYEELREHIRLENERRREKVHFFLAMHSSTPLAEHLRDYSEKLKQLPRIGHRK